MTGRKRGPRGTAERFRRLLIMLPWLAERGSVATAEMAQRFGVSVPELVADLELAAMCGLPPYLDEVLDIIVDDEEVSLGVPRLFTRPLRLTAPEAFGLLAAARVTAAVPGVDSDGALARALEKLSALVPADEVDVDLAAPEATEDLTRAVDHAGVMSVRYWSSSSQRITERIIEPLRVYSDRGQWYLWAFDRGVNERRVFRVDRFESWEPTGETFTSSDPGPVPAWFEGADDAVTVVLRVGASVAWVLDNVAATRIEPLPDGRVEAEIVVVDQGWLGRLLVRLGPSAEVVDPPSLRDLARRCAQSVLSRYEVE
jgi:proteasome accessory factor C